MLIEKNVSIEFSFNEWMDHFSKINQNSKRKRFLVDFHDKLSFKLQQEKHCKCWLKCNYNWFNNRTYWSGSYKCIYEKCGNNFYAFCKNEPIINQNVLLKVHFKDENVNHDQIIKKKRYYGDKRSNIALEVMSKGISNLIDENVIYNFENDLQDNFYESK